MAIVAFLVWAYRPVPSFEPFSYDPVPADTWPTDEWLRASPEAQGLASETLLALVDRLDEMTESDPEFFLDSLTIIRNGHIVAEVYPNPNYPRGRMHVLHSATKSIVSALIGIAIDRGMIGSVDVRLVDIFTGRQMRNLDPRKQALTIRDLLTMQTGLHSRDSYLYGNEGLLALQQSDDWLQFALDLPMAADPGTRFDYSNISTFLLGAVLAETTQTDVLSFAREALFDPLGIKDVRWERTRDGLPIAWARMWMKPNDLAKIGLLYLQNGQWDGQQIISVNWIQDSLTPHAFPKNAVDVLNPDMTPNRETSTQNWVSQRFMRTFSDGYGYQWWLDREGNYTALGMHGQYLLVSPETNMVVVATCKCRGLAQFAPAKLFYDFVLSSVHSADPLPSADESDGPLVVLASALPIEPWPEGPPPNPDIAHAISGRIFRMEPNPYNTDNLKLDFSEDTATGELSYTAREDWRVRYTFGLDGVARLVENETGAYVVKGKWTAPDTMELEVEIVGYTTSDRWEFQFGPDDITVTEHSITGSYTYTGQATSP